jgi:hypothetical protein
LCGEHLQELCTVYLTRFRTYKIALKPKLIPRRGGVPQTDKHLLLSPLQINLKKADIKDWSLLVIWSML